MVNLWLELVLEVEEDNDSEAEADDGVVMGLDIVVGHMRARGGVGAELSPIVVIATVMGGDGVDLCNMWDDFEATHDGGTARSIYLSDKNESFRTNERSFPLTSLHMITRTLTKGNPRPLCTGRMVCF